MKDVSDEGGVLGYTYEEGSAGEMGCPDSGNPNASNKWWRAGRAMRTQGETQTVKHTNVAHKNKQRRDGKKHVNLQLRE